MHETRPAPCAWGRSNAFRKLSPSIHHNSPMLSMAYHCNVRFPDVSFTDIHFIMITDHHIHSVDARNNSYHNEQSLQHFVRQLNRNFV